MSVGKAQKTQSWWLAKAKEIGEAARLGRNWENSHLGQCEQGQFFVFFFAIKVLRTYGKIW
jgi:hypothetical protein